MPGYSVEALMFCSYCGLAAPEDPTARFCTGCGNALRQAPSARGRLVTPAGSYDLAGFGVRAGGFIIDALLFLGVFAVITVGVYAAVADGSPRLSGADADREVVQGGLWVLAVIIGPWVFNSAGWSPGKRALGLRIVDDRGRRPGIGSGFARTAGAYVSSVALGAGFLWSAADRGHQTWHDKVAGTYVVRV